MATPDEILEANLANPAEASSDLGSVKQHKLPDLIAAAEYLDRRKAAESNPTGMRIMRFVPPGMS